METVKTSCGICHKVGPFPGKRQTDKPRHACLYADYPSKGNPPDDELEANARLIASAPDLLEACKTIVAWDDAENNAEAWEKDQGAAWRERQQLCALAFDLARSALAKATGSTP
jgi:hypothetical protein